MSVNLQLNSKEIKQKLIEFIRSEVSKAGFQKGIIGLSGGIDSAVVTYLSAQALGKDNVVAVMMPYKTSSPESLADAKVITRQLGIRSEIIEITPMVDAYLARAREMSAVRKGNIMARQRMIVLYDISAREKGLVIGTSNKTEILLGYGTLFGDTACAINPIGELYKTQVWQLAEELGIPKKIIDKKPTADLWEGQTDEGELGFTYKHVDQLLQAMIDEGLKDEELHKRGFEKDFIAKVQSLIKQNEFKRRPVVIAKIGK